MGADGTGRTRARSNGDGWGPQEKRDETTRSGFQTSGLVSDWVIIRDHPSCLRRLWIGRAPSTAPVNEQSSHGQATTPSGWSGQYAVPARARGATVTGGVPRKNVMRPPGLVSRPVVWSLTG